MNRNLTVLLLENVKIHSYQLIYWIESSLLNLKKLKLNSVSLLQDKPFDLVLDFIAKTKFINLESLFIGTNVHNPIHFKSICTLLNHIRVFDVAIECENISYDSVDQVLSSQITNSYIISLDIIQSNFHPNVKALENFNFMSIWKDKSQLKSLNCTYFEKDIKSLDGMVKLNSLTFKIPYLFRKNQIILFENILKKTKITSLNMQIYLCGRAYNSQILLQNHTLTHLTIRLATLSNCLTILGCQHPTLKSLRLCIYVNTDPIVSPIVPAIQNNHTITHLNLGTSLPKTDFNPFSSLIDILKVNRTLVSLKLPQNDLLKIPQKF
ncbi:hypothetical protein DLAC_06522 [Tieghemostelium lacteum]|uniref:Uncharacterized protein n=1 Tax=Tieghemostelium lacteum TaxID=361077 RepID=A0A151ZF87_TIELA|nr:hypothetical protein DLAC_06522 [Tieghemostelium lacteum]|eukprot:KYQ92530.1 hypothetical protein DLAC_06522 [Tieghemostelium lacteum]